MTAKRHDMHSLVAMITLAEFLAVVLFLSLESSCACSGTLASDISSATSNAARWVPDGMVESVARRRNNRVLQVVEASNGTEATSSSNATMSNEALVQRSDIDAVMEMIATRPELSTIAAALRISNFAHVLCNSQSNDDSSTNPNTSACHRNRNITIFAPTNAAFVQFPNPELWGKLLTPEWSVHLVELLSFHVTTTPFSSLGITNGTATTLEMLNGENATAEVVFKDEGATTTATILLTSDFTNTSNVMDANNAIVSNTANGSGITVYIIDTVLIPSFVVHDLVTIRKTPLGRRLFTILDDILETLNISPLLSIGDDDLTVFAATDEAFLALDNDTLAAFYNVDNYAATFEIMLNHGIAGMYPSPYLVPGESLESEGGNQLYISLVNATSGNETTITSTLMVNDAVITLRDILVNDGIIHAIDKVLIKPYTAPNPAIATTTNATSTDAPTLLNATLSPSNSTTTTRPSLSPSSSSNNNTHNTNSSGRKQTQVSVAITTYFYLVLVFIFNLVP